MQSTASATHSLDFCCTNSSFSMSPLSNRLAPVEPLACDELRKRAATDETPTITLQFDFHNRQQMRHLSYSPRAKFLEWRPAPFRQSDTIHENRAHLAD